MDKLIELNNRGVSHFLNHRFKEAEDSYNKVLEMDAQNATALNNLGLLYHQQKQYNNAEKCFKQAIDANPRSSYFLNLANVQVFLKKLELAEEHYIEACKLDSKNRKAKVSLARFYEARQLFPQAADVWFELVMQTNETGYKISLAGNKMAMGHFEEALAILSKLTDQAESAEVYHQIGICELSLKNYGLALLAFRNSLGFAPDKLVTRHYLAVTLLAAGEYEKALKEFDFLLKMEPESIKFRLDKVSVLLSLQRIDETRLLLDQILKRDPGNEKAAKYLTMING
ncbi:MAG: tetratricopeptide repeat protein [Draconibacterium sp.]